MTSPTIVFTISAAAIVVVSMYLTVAKSYRTGLLGSLGFFMAVLGFGSMLFEFAGGVEFKVLPQVAMGTAGVAIFMVQHVARSIRFRRKRESSLGAKERALSFNKEC